MIARFRKPALFTLALLPVAAVAAYFTALYQMDFLDEAMLSQALEQMGGKSGFIAVYILQIVIYMLVMGFLGCILAEKLGLKVPGDMKWTSVKRTLLLSAAAGVLFSLDYWTFGRWIPGVQESTADMLNAPVILASVLYGGVVEEVMLRLFFMSLLAWLMWKIFFRRSGVVPAAVLAAANILAALLFAAGHLPATAMIFGEISPLLLLRCFLLNGGFGLFFGWLYRRGGIGHAMIGHAMAHVVSKGIWLIFI